MTTLTTDTKLEFELQELYLTGKQWLSDLEFIRTESLFLNEIMQRSTRYISPVNAGIDITEIYAKLGQPDKADAGLALEIVSFMNKLEPLIVGTGVNLDLKLIEDFVQLRERVNKALTVLKAAKLLALEINRERVPQGAVIKK